MVDASLRHYLPKFREQASRVSRQKLQLIEGTAIGPNDARGNRPSMQLYPYWPWERVPSHMAPIYASRKPRDSAS
jgi:hypothetical protein